MFSAPATLESNVWVATCTHTATNHNLEGIRGMLKAEVTELPIHRNNASAAPTAVQHLQTATACLHWNRPQAIAVYSLNAVYSTVCGGLVTTQTLLPQVTGEAAVSHHKAVHQLVSCESECSLHGHSCRPTCQPVVIAPSHCALQREVPKHLQAQTQCVEP
jgi:hypothetical protein